MLRFVGRQVVHLLVVMVGAVTITFVALRLSGNPLDALLPAEATEEQRRILTEQLGLDHSVLEQYWLFLTHAARFDFGRSIITGRPAASLVGDQFGESLLLAVVALAVSAVAGIALGVLAATHRGGVLDRVVNAISSVAQAAPLFWVGLILIIVFAVRLHWLPASGMDGAGSLVLPVATLALGSMPYILRLTRTTMLDVLDTDFVRFHRAKGLPERSVVGLHALKNCLPPVATLIGLQAGPLLGGVVVIEYIFGRSGVGTLLISSIYSRDYPVVQTAVLVIVLAVVVANVLADLAVAVIDPRVRVGKGVS
ncbi:ABC transporter permease [Dactylosporangium sp. CA-092794]|uniref:ABC transporter permease n=1 Tax=Dactylosporangium sp. CA-092794 TaxID=3239929 RepID=UPI003D8C2104